MRFQDLSIGQGFKFASEVDPAFRFSGMERGPWEKVSARCYVKLPMSNRALFACVVSGPSRLAFAGSPENVSHLVAVHSPSSVLPCQWPEESFGAGWVNVHFGRRVAPFRPIQEVTA